MPFASQEEKEFVIKELGYDPATTDITDDYQLMPKTQVSPPASAGTGVMTIPKLQLGAENTPLQTFGKTFLHEAPAAIGGGAAAAGTLAALGGAASLTGVGLPVGLLAMLAAGYAGSRLTRGVQEAVEPESWKQGAEQAAMENPTAALLGNVATMPLAGFRPGMSTVRAATGLGKLVTGLERTPQETSALINAAINAGIQPVSDIAISQAEGRPLPSAKDLLFSAALGSTFTTPVGPYKRVFPHVEGKGPLDTGTEGAVPQAEIDAIAEKLLAKNKEAQTTVIKPQTIIENPADVGNVKGKKFVPQNQAARSALHMEQLLRETPEQKATLEKLNNPDIASEWTAQDEANLDVIKQRMWGKPRSEVSPRSEGREGFFYQKEPEVSGTGEERPRYQPQSETSEVESPRLSRSADIASQLRARGLSGKPSAIMLEKFRKWGADLAGIKLQEDGSLVNDKGEPVAGVLLMKNGVKEMLSKINPAKAGLDTIPHEMLGHGFLRRLRESPKKADREFARKFEELVSQDPEYQRIKAEEDAAGRAYDPEEFIASQQGLEFIQDKVLGRGEGVLKEFWRDLTSHIKTRFTEQGTMEDFRRMFNYKGVNQPRVEGITPSIKVNAAQEQRNQPASELQPTPEDYARYQEVQQQIRDKVQQKDMDSPEFMGLFKEFEDLRNKYGGMPLKEPTSITTTQQELLPTEEVSAASKFAKMREAAGGDERRVAEADREIMREGEMLGQAKYQPESDLPYGYWISPDGKFIPVNKAFEHERTARNILSDLNIERNQKVEPHQQLESMGYVRGIVNKDTNTIETDSETRYPLSNKVRKSLKDFAIENNINAKHYTGKGWGKTDFIHETNPEETRYSRESLLSKAFKPLRAEIDKVEQDFGPQGKIVAGDFNKGFRGFYEQKDRLTGELNGEGIVNQFLNKLNPVEWFVKRTNPDIERVGEYMLEKSYGKTPKYSLTPRQQEIERSIRDNLLHSVALKNAEPTLRNTVPDPGYYPQVPKDSVLNVILNKVGTPEYGKLYNDFINYHRSIGTPDPASKFKEFLGGYEKQEVSLASSFGPVDKSAGVGIPPSWADSSPAKVMPRFNNRYARRIAYERAINSKPDVLAALDELKRADTVKNVLFDIQGKTEYNEAWRNAAGGVVRAAMLGPLTGAKDFVTNLELGLQHTNPLELSRSTIDAIQNFKENWKKSFETGVNRHNFGTLEIGDGGIDAVSSVLRRVRDILNSVQGRNILELTNRTIAFGQGNFLAQAALDAGKKGRLSGQQNKFLQDFAPDWKTAKVTPDYLAQIAARYARSVQGSYDYRGLPSLTQKGSLAPVLSLARWNVEKFNNFRKYVVEPAFKGNLTPLLMSTIGMLIGGTAVQKLVEEVTGKKEKTAKWGEIASTAGEPDARTKEAVAYKLAALASLSGYAGVMGDLTKSGMDVLMKNMPQTYGNPLLEGVANGGRLIAEAVDAMRQGNFNFGADLLSQVLEDYVQGYRLAINKLSPEKKSQQEQTNRNRDLRVWKQLTGRDVSSYQGQRANPFTDQDVREFKKTSDISRAVELLPSLISKAIEEAHGDPERLKSELGKLKRNSYQTFPSPERTPETFYKYIQYLYDSQGIEEASKALTDYVTQTQINQAKSGMVPSL